MKLFVADSLLNVPIIEIVSQLTHESQTPIKYELFRTSRNIQNSDAILVPHDAFYFSKHKAYVDYINDLAEYKHVIFSDRGDFPKNPRIQNSIRLRIAINPGESTNNNIVIPYNVRSLEFLDYRNYSPEPKISFTGFVPKYTPRRFLKSLKNSPLHPVIGNSSLVRNFSINKIKTSKLDFDYTKREMYFLSEEDRVERADKRSQFISQIQNSDIVLCPRGDANQSQRFYEVLSAGRIPLIPKTKMKFPSLNNNNQFYQSRFIYFNLLGVNLNRKILDFWLQLENQENYLRIQKSIRRFYIEELDFTKHVKNLFSMDLYEILQLANFKSE